MQHKSWTSSHGGFSTFSKGPVTDVHDGEPQLTMSRANKAWRFTFSSGTPRCDVVVVSWRSKEGSIAYRFRDSIQSWHAIKSYRRNLQSPVSSIRRIAFKLKPRAVLAGEFAPRRLRGKRPLVVDQSLVFRGQQRQLMLAYGLEFELGTAILLLCIS